MAWLLAFGGASLLGAGITWLVPEGAGPDLSLGDAPAIVLVIGIALVSPLVETILMGGVLDVLTRFLRPWLAVVVSAAGWGVAHSLLAPLWGAVIWWPFLIFSTVFVTWRRRGFWRAVGLATVVHILQNTGPSIALALGY